MFDITLMQSISSLLFLNYYAVSKLQMGQAENTELSEMLEMLERISELSEMSEKISELSEMSRKILELSEKYWRCHNFRLFSEL